MKNIITNSDKIPETFTYKEILNADKGSMFKATCREDCRFLICTGVKGPFVLYIDEYRVSEAMNHEHRLFIKVKHPITIQP